MQVSRDAILQGIGIFLPHGSDIYEDVQISCKSYFSYLVDILKDCDVTYFLKCSDY